MDRDKLSLRVCAALFIWAKFKAKEIEQSKARLAACVYCIQVYVCNARLAAQAGETSLLGQ